MAGSEEDKRASKMVRSVLARRGIDATRADVRVQKGLCSIRGYVSAMPGSHIADIEIEIEQVAHIIRQKGEIRNVILEVTCK
jgi:hypothetical protein